MTYKTFLNKLEWDTSSYELNKYIKGEKRLPDNLRKYHSKLNKIIPVLYERQKKANEKFGRDLVASQLFRLAFHKVGYTNRDRFNEEKIENTFIQTVRVMTQIIERVNNSVAQGGENISEMLKEYCED